MYNVTKNYLEKISENKEVNPKILNLIKTSLDTEVITAALNSKNLKIVSAALLNPISKNL